MMVAFQWSYASLKKHQVNDVLKLEIERLFNLDKEFRIDIIWEQKKSSFGLID